MRYELKAIAAGGQVESLEFQAADEAAAIQGAEGRGYTVLSVRAGLPLVEAIDTLAQKEKRDPFRVTLLRVVALLREGRPLSAALDEFPQAFSPLYVATVKATEKTTDLPAALGRFVAYAQQLEAVRKRIVNASIYPALLIVVGAMVGLFLLLYVVPRFGHIYQERGTDLPLFSRLLLASGKAIDRNGPIALGVIAGLVVLCGYLLRTQDVRRAMGDTLWRLPSIGERLKVYQLARFYRTIGMLLRGGMPLPRALEMGAELLHPLLRDRLFAANQAISEGRGVSASLEARGLVTPVAVRMLVVGEKSGNMGEMLEQVAAFHDEELARWVDWFTRLFEPLLMAIIGLVIGVIVVLMYMPIFELAGNLR